VCTYPWQSTHIFGKKVTKLNSLNSHEILERYFSTSISQENSVGIVAGYELEGQVLIPSREFSLFLVSR
jgi:hypothetical protein